MTSWQVLIVLALLVILALSAVGVSAVELQGNDHALRGVHISEVKDDAPPSNAGEVTRIHDGSNEFLVASR
ncbi:MAG: hypothetical protein ACYC5M_07450 [Anaerolineae bacterium]